MSIANATLLTPVLDLKGAWTGVWLHDDVSDALLQQLTSRFPHLTLYTEGAAGLVTGIASADQLTAARTAGGSAFCGPYISHPPADPSAIQDAGRGVLLQLLSLVIQDADNAQIEQVFKRDPGLSFHLFRLVNSPGMGLTSKISSFNQALMVLGRRQLQRWIQLLLYASRQEGGSSPLLIFAAMRGHLLEKMAGARGGDAVAREQAFMTGIFSLLDSLLGMSLAEIAKSIRLGDEVQAALLDRQGVLGQLLVWVEAVHAGQALPPPAEISVEQCIEYQMDALGWALDIEAGIGQGAAT